MFRFLARNACAAMSAKGIILSTPGEMHRKPFNSPIENPSEHPLSSTRQFKPRLQTPSATMPRTSTSKKATYITIVGLRRSDSGRKCCQHPGGCGKYLTKSEDVTFQKGTIDRGYGPGLKRYDCIRVYSDSCFIGFVGEEDRPLLAALPMDGGRVLQILEDGDTKSKRRDYLKNGAAIVAVYLPLH
ncbi:hypothetical protein DFS34DRAFT_365679 [Phlyctochytrium arcticum]|nr:hypothetical protein DFS34DRAFT_365679 [Phlyctochytrium arcticum]